MKKPIDNLPLRNSAQVEDFTGFDLPEFLEEILDSMASLNNVPGIPIQIETIPAGVAGLAERQKQLTHARDGLVEKYNIDLYTETAKKFLFGDRNSLEQALGLLEKQAEKNLQHLTQVSRIHTLVRERGSLFEKEILRPDSELTKLFLKKPEDWTISLTDYRDVRVRASSDCEKWMRVLSDRDEATKQFWPMIAENGLAYNLLFLRKLRTGEHTRLRELFGESWNAVWENTGDIFLIDLTIFSKFKPAEVDGFPRFTPGCMVVLQKSADGNLLPVAVRLSAYKDRTVETYLSNGTTDEAWLYALMAAKTAVTVYGIWLGHVYHWHIVTAAMLMGFLNRIPEEHRLYPLVKPQSNHLIAFDQILLLIWKEIAPPTSFDSSWSFLQLMNAFGEGRSFFDDDPKVTLARNGITEADFTVHEAWDRYPIVKRFLGIWKGVEDYVKTVVEALYSDDESVVADADLQAWMEESRAPLDGNIKGLPDINSRERLREVLTSLLYRITMHGCSRLERSLSPAYSYVPNYPVCLQKTDFPKPQDKPELMSYMPNTGTLGSLFNFYGIFIFSRPYESLIEDAEPTANLFFDNETCNEALVRLRTEILNWMEEYQPGMTEQLTQWPLGVET